MRTSLARRCFRFNCSVAAATEEENGEVIQEVHDHLRLAAATRDRYFRLVSARGPFGNSTPPFPPGPSAPCSFRSRLRRWAPPAPAASRCPAAIRRYPQLQRTRYRPPCLQTVLRLNALWAVRPACPTVQLAHIGRRPPVQPLRQGFAGVMEEGPTHGIPAGDFGRAE